MTDLGLKAVGNAMYRNRLKLLRSWAMRYNEIAGLTEGIAAGR